jgi:hypothetical protein
MQEILPAWKLQREIKERPWNCWFIPSTKVPSIESRQLKETQRFVGAFLIFDILCA